MHHTHTLYILNDELKVALHASACTDSMTDCWTDKDVPRSESSNRPQGTMTFMSAASWQKDMHAGRHIKQACAPSFQPAHLGRGVVVATHALKVHA